MRYFDDCKYFETESPALLPELKKNDEYRKFCYETEKTLKLCCKFKVLEKQDEAYVLKDESLLSAIYAYVLIIRLDYLKRSEHISLFKKYVNTIKANREQATMQVKRIGCLPCNYSAICCMTAIILGSYQNKEIERDVYEIFKNSFRGIYKQVKKYGPVIFYDEFSGGCYQTMELVAHLYFCNREGKDTTIHVWGCVHDFIKRMLEPKVEHIPQKKKITRNKKVDKFFKRYGFYFPDYRLEDRDFDNLSVLDGTGLHEMGMELIPFFQNVNELMEFHLDLYINTLETPALPEKIEIIPKEPARNDESDVFKKRMNDMALQMERMKNCHDREIQTLLEKNQRMQEELDELRELEVLEKEEIQDDLTELRDKIKDKRILIVGGFSKWHCFLRKEFPNWHYIDTGSGDNAPVPNLFKMDGIFFYSKHMRHSLFGKYVSLCRTKNIKFHYLTSQNINNVIREVYEALSETK